MVIETRYNMGDTVFFMHDNAVHSSEIRIINIEKIFDFKERILYSLYAGSVKLSVNEKDCYPSKEELLKAL